MRVPGPELFEKIRSFAVPNKIVVEILKYLTTFVSEKDIRVLRDAYRVLDVDHNGYISP